LFERSKETGRLVAAHHPFTIPVNIDQFENPETAIAQAYDFVLNGYEVAGGSIRINTEQIQNKMFEILQLSPEQISKNFGFLLKAFKYGVPPHGGIAFGLDRLFMILFRQSSIREVIAFPKNSNGIDSMSGSPNEIQ
jgi:aspartyl-tRNA synthetase